MNLKMTQYVLFFLLSLIVLTGCNENSNTMSIDNKIGYQKNITKSITYQKKDITVDEKIVGLYVAYFNRAPDIDGILYWLNEVDKSISNGGNPSDVFRKISKGFSEHDIFISTYSHLNNKNFINAIYQNMSGKDGDAEGIAYWKGELDRGVSRSDMVASFVEALLTDDFNEDRFSYLSPEEKTKAQARQDYLTNKVFVSIHFLNNLWSLTNITTYPIENDPSYLASKNILVGITEDASTVTTATAFLDSIKDDADPIGKINNNGNTAKKIKGQFIDSPVEGLSYRVGNFHGTTTKDGYFEYTEAGENIFFYIGNLNIGVAKAGKNIHINDLEGDFISDRNTKIAQLLLSLDTDGDPTNNIQLPQNIASRFDDSSDFSFDIPQDEFDTQLKNKLKEWNIDNFVDSDKADEHIKKSGIELAKLCPLPNPKNTYENKEITDLSCIDKARLDYFYKRVAPLFHSSMNAEYAQTVIIDEEYNEKTAQKAIQVNPIISSLETLDAFIDVADANAKGKVFEKAAKTATLLSKYTQTLVNTSLLFKEPSSTKQEATIRFNKYATISSDVLNTIFNVPACISMMNSGKSDDGSCSTAIISAINVAKTNLSLTSNLKPIDKVKQTYEMNRLLHTMQIVKDTYSLGTAKNKNEISRALFSISSSFLAMGKDAILSSYRSQDGKTLPPKFDPGYIGVRVIDKIAQPIVSIGKECVSFGLDDPRQKIKCFSKKTQEIGKLALETSIAIIGNVQMISTVKNMNEQIVASRVLEELLFAGSANYKKVYNKYNITYGGNKYEQYISFGALIEAIGKKELGFNGIQGYESWFSSAWTSVVDRHPFSVEDVRFLVSSAYKRIVRETSIDFESPAIDISVINYNQVGARDIRMDIESSKHYGVKDTKLVCYADYDSNRSLLSPWSGSFNDKFSFFEDTNTHFFKIGFETSGYRNLSCNLYANSGVYLGSKSVSLGVLAPKNLDMGSDKTIYEGQSVTLDVPKIIDSDIRIVKYRYSHINPFEAYGENSSSEPFTINNLKLNSDGTSSTHEILVTISTNNGILEKQIIKVTVLPKDKDTMVAPKNLTATSTTDSITLNWDEVSNASIYKICMSTSPISDGSNCEENGGTLISGSTSTTKTITDNLNVDTTYYFRVRGLSSEYDGGLWSDEVSITVLENNNINYISSYDTNDKAYDVVLSNDGKKAFVADFDAGLQIIDISNPKNPFLIGNFDTSGSAWGITLSSDETKAFIADGYSGVQIIDISNPKNPFLIGTFDTSYANKVTLSSDGKKAFVADSTSGLQIIDINNLKNPSLIKNFHTNGYAYEVTLSKDGTKAFVADGSSGLQIIDISNLENPFLIGNFDAPLALGVTLSSDETKAFVAYGYNGLYIIDITNLRNPFLIGDIETSLAMSVTLSNDETKAFVADRDSGLKIIDISDLKNPYLIKNFDTSGKVFSVTLSNDGTKVFIADYDDGLVILDISN